MNMLSYKNAESKVLGWYESDQNLPFVVVFTDDKCENCKHFENNLQNTIEQHGIEVFYVSLNRDRIAFPPLYTPTTFWYFTKDAPPMTKRGAPPDIDSLRDFLTKILLVNKGESTVEQEFF